MFPNLLQSGLNPALPFYILGAVGIVASAVAINLPETADQKLADTVEEAEEFGRGQVGFSNMPQFSVTSQEKRRLIQKT